MHRLADREVGDYERAFLAEIAATVDQIDDAALRSVIDRIWARLEDATLNGQRAVIPAELLAEAASALGITDRLARGLRTRYERLILRSVDNAGTAMARLTPATVSVRFDRTNPKAIQWARRHAGELVREVTRGTRRAIRREIVTGFRAQRTVPDTARALRGVIGLTESQGAAVTRFRTVTLPDMNARAVEGRALLATQKERLRSLKARFPTAAKPYTADDIASIADKYAAKKVRERALAIARTETIRASAGGQVELWRQSSEKGLIDVGVARKIWVYTKDSRTECSCKSIPLLNPKGVPLDKPFKMRDCRTGAVRLVYLPGDSHPLCRCALGMVYHQDEADVADEEG